MRCCAMVAGLAHRTTVGCGGGGGDVLYEIHWKSPPSNPSCPTSKGSNGTRRTGASGCGSSRLGSEQTVPGSDRPRDLARGTGSRLDPKRAIPTRQPRGMVSFFSRGAIERTPWNASRHPTFVGRTKRANGGRELCVHMLKWKVTRHRRDSPRPSPERQFKSRR